MNYQNNIRFAADPHIESANALRQPVNDGSPPVGEWNMDALERRREFFSRLVTAHVRGDDGRLQAAFRSTPREKFLGAGPWRAFTAAGYLDIPEDDVGLVYQDIPIALAHERGINNGQPSLHALCLAALAPRPGEHALHIGAGAGYYTAILAHLVGADLSGSGQVDAYEIEPDLAARAAENLAALPGVRVHAGDGTQAGLPAAGIIYVNAGAAAPAPAWLASLAAGGRLLFPLTSASGAGAMLLATCTQDRNLWDARLLLPVAFIPCVGAQDPTHAAALAAAFERGGWKDVRSMRRGTPPDASAWYRGGDWWLSTEPISVPPTAA